MLLPEPVGATERTSRPASIAATTSDCPGLNASSPKTSLSARSALSIISPECDGISRRDQRPLTRRSAQRRSGCSYPDARGGFADALRYRRRSSDATAGGDADAAGYPAVATGSPRRRDRPSVHRDRLEGTHELQRSELGMDRRQGSGGEAEACRAVSAGLGNLRTRRAAAKSRRCFHGENTGRGGLAGGAPGRDACPGGRVPAWRSGAVAPSPTSGRILVLRLHLPQSPELAPGRQGDGCWCGSDHAASLERHGSPPDTGAADKCQTLLRGADGLARWALRTNHAKTGWRRGPSRPFRAPAVARPGRGRTNSYLSCMMPRQFFAGSINQAMRANPMSATPSTVLSPGRS